ncbi:unnamed protein product [Protopolystoma xenopodis]|uniref:Uncharacterized protein n=1 Tax=Protopolystoma xenopodis TaxID=117903 RepID=A0A3S5B263_9PLAT|nr:unnamed protein product [Protopolystoma xenopodis]
MVQRLAELPDHHRPDPLLPQQKPTELMGCRFARPVSTLRGGGASACTSRVCRLEHGCLQLSSVCLGSQSVISRIGIQQLDGSIRTLCWSPLILVDPLVVVVMALLLGLSHHHWPLYQRLSCLPTLSRVGHFNVIPFGVANWASQAGP